MRLLEEVADVTIVIFKTVKMAAHMRRAFCPLLQMARNTTLIRFELPSTYIV